MLVLASADSAFLGKWNQVVGQSGAVVQVGSISSLKSWLAVNTAQLVALDMTLAGGRDPAILRSIAEAKKGARLILSGIQFSPAAELSGLAVGAVACCPASLSVEKCRKILSVVQGGGVWLSSAGIPALVDKLRDFSARSSEAARGPETGNGAVSEDIETLFEGLTKREREIARLVGSGSSNKDIAHELDISDRTVKAHLTTIFNKLQVRDRLQLAMRVSGNSAGN
ncbi:MAG: response regulator transcription factor [Burkholderiaceae bacterium]|jgi:DNA-binding NarL/FixJ family response regulator|nr:response regulator transcription factor [Burkholderiaceae bacterium]